MISSTPDSSTNNLANKIPLNIDLKPNPPQKRNSLVSPVSIRSFNSIANLASKNDSSNNVPVISSTRPNNNFMKLPPAYPSLLSANSSLPNCASREKRFSFSVEKFGQSLLPPKSSVAHIFDKNKSYLDLSQNKSTLGLGLLMSNSNSNLNGSINNISRSCSLYNYELDYVELKKMQITNTTSLMNGNNKTSIIKISKIKFEQQILHWIVSLRL